MNDGEELDSWSVLVNGCVEIVYQNGPHETQILTTGDAFGILPTMDKLYHRGVMRTKVDDCQFVCITQTDYYRYYYRGYFTFFIYTKMYNSSKRKDDNTKIY